MVGFIMLSLAETRFWLVYHAVLRRHSSCGFYHAAVAACFFFLVFLNFIKKNDFVLVLYVSVNTFSIMLGPVLNQYSADDNVSCPRSRPKLSSSEPLRSS